jgi:hypothetical protein
MRWHKSHRYFSHWVYTSGEKQNDITALREQSWNLRALKEELADAGL